VVHDGTHYDLLKVKVKVGNPAVFERYLLRHLQWELASDHGFLN